MAFSTSRFRDSAAVVCAHDGAELSALRREGLVQLQRDLGAARQALDVLAAQVAGQLFADGEANPGPGNIARSSGYRNARDMVGDALGTTPREAQRLVDMGLTLARAESEAAAPVASPAASVDEGSKVPAAPVPRLLVAAAVREGGLAIDKAALVTATLDALGAGEEAEESLLRMAFRLKFHDLKRVCERELHLKDPRGLEERDRQLYEDRWLSLTDDPSGMTRVAGMLPPVQAGHLRAWLDAQVRASMRAKRKTPGDVRTASQMRADALAMLAHHGIGCSDPGSGVKTVLVVRTTVEALETGVGVATCDSFTTPISIETLRLMAVDAGVVPIVMGGESVPLDVGRLHRLASWYQRMAVLERDGGCAWCHAPASFTDIHHITGWVHMGDTDLDNLVALCVSCHHRVHYGGWVIEVVGGSVYFTPPAGIDPTRARRKGGLADLEFVY